MDVEIPWEQLYETKVQEIRELKGEIDNLKSLCAQSGTGPIVINKKPSLKSPSELPGDLYSMIYIEKFRDIFFRYATVFSCNENFIDLTHFRLIFNELGLGKKDLNWTKGELIYHSVSKRTNIDFEKFVRLMKKIAYQRFKTTNYLEKLEPLLKIPDKRIDIIDKNIQQWIEDSQIGRVKEVMSSYDELLRVIFSVFSSKSVKHQNRLGLSNLLEFCSDCKIVPAIVSHLEVSRIFHVVEDGESLGYEEFLTTFACIGILGMGKIGIQNTVHAIDKILVILSGNSEFIYNKKNQPPRWN